MQCETPGDSPRWQLEKLCLQMSCNLIAEWRLPIWGHDWSLKNDLSYWRNSWAVLWTCAYIVSGRTVLWALLHVLHADQAHRAIWWGMHKQSAVPSVFQQSFLMNIFPAFSCIFQCFVEPSEDIHWNMIESYILKCNFILPQNLFSRRKLSV
jgi:hypothetical protein